MNLLEEWDFKIFNEPRIANKMDACLLSALVKRWRSETNTFHFFIREMSITLEDVFYILGLPVEGMPITCGLYIRPK